MSKSLSQQLSDARLMLSGARKNLETLKSIGMSESYIAELDEALTKAANLDSKQESLKAELMTCTAELRGSLDSLYKLVSATKKRVKLVIPKEGWKEFGISDKM